MMRQGQFRFSYFTRDYDTTVSFYRDGLELPVVESWDRSADDRGTLFAAASGIIEVPDVEDAYRRATERNLSIREELTTQPWGHRSFCVREPNGLVIYVFSEV